MLINGESFSWAQASFNVLGVDIKGITGINYSSAQEKTNNRGAGVEPISRGRGGKTYSGTITLKEEEIRAIENALPPGKDVMDIAPFPVVVVYKRNGILYTDVIKNVEFLDRGTDLNTETTDMEYQFNIILAGIERN